MMDAIKLTGASRNRLQQDFRGPTVRNHPERHEADKCPKPFALARRNPLWRMPQSRRYTLRYVCKSPMPYNARMGATHRHGRLHDTLVGLQRFSSP